MRRSPFSGAMFTATSSMSGPPRVTVTFPDPVELDPAVLERLALTMSSAQRDGILMRTLAEMLTAEADRLATTPSETP